MSGLKEEQKWVSARKGLIGASHHTIFQYRALVRRSDGSWHMDYTDVCCTRSTPLDLPTMLQPARNPEPPVCKHESSDQTPVLPICSPHRLAQHNMTSNRCVTLAEIKSAVQHGLLHTIRHVEAEGGVGGVEAARTAGR